MAVLLDLVGLSPKDCPGARALRAKANSVLLRRWSAAAGRQECMAPNHNTRKRVGHMGAGVAVGVGVGAALGVALDSLGIGMAIGAAIGVVLGLAMSRSGRSGSSQGPT